MLQCAIPCCIIPCCAVLYCCAIPYCAVLHLPVPYLSVKERRGRERREGRGGEGRGGKGEEGRDRFWIPCLVLGLQKLNILKGSCTASKTLNSHLISMQHRQRSNSGISLSTGKLCQRRTVFCTVRILFYTVLHKLYFTALHCTFLLIACTHELMKTYLHTRTRTYKYYSYLHTCTRTYRHWMRLSGSWI